MLHEITLASTAFEDGVITRECVVQLVQNRIDNTYKKSPTEAPRKITHTGDSYCSYFKKSDLDRLFTRNGCPPGSPDTDLYGLRIFFGLHGTSQIELTQMPHRPMYFIGQHTVVLVCTKNGRDMLIPGSTVAAANDEGQICPPPLPCASIDGELHD